MFIISYCHELIIYYFQICWKSINLMDKKHFNVFEDFALMSNENIVKVLNKILELDLYMENVSSNLTQVKTTGLLVSLDILATLQ